MPRPQRIRLRRVLFPAGLLLLGIVVAGCSGASAGGPKLNWTYFFDTLFRPDDKIRFGLWLTVSIAILSQFIGVVLGTFAALGKMSKVGPIRWIANIYIWLFRGTPLVVQIVLFYFGLSVARIYQWPALSVPGATIDGAIQAGVFALGVNEGAYFAEIVRAGILSIDPGQTEAGKALGMTYGQIMRRIVLPQAARVIVPPLGNEFNNMLKTTSLLVLISVPELYTIVNRKQGNAFAPFEFYLAAAVWYLLMTTIWSVIQSWIERRLAKGTAGAASAGPSLRERLFGGSRAPLEDLPVISGGR
ncbi:MAG TPA: amino acid ABC transporter permease [Candidatus Dormibacteraeota bacterium]|nr:amino acid ABC transporter permease [Candidatus Dormibacteraeota bacterium]